LGYIVPFSPPTINRSASHGYSGAYQALRTALNLSVAGLIAYLSAPIVANLLSSRQVMNTSFEPFRIVNTYGAFGSVTRYRTEIVFEGTHSAGKEDDEGVRRKCTGLTLIGGQFRARFD
jgi:hypothetical protein